MTATEINREIEVLARDERLKVQAFLVHLERANDRKRLETLDAKITRMQAGHAVTPEELHLLASILDKAGE